MKAKCPIGHEFEVMFPPPAVAENHFQKGDQEADVGKWANIRTLRMVSETELDYVKEQYLVCPDCGIVFHFMPQNKILEVEREKAKRDLEASRANQERLKTLR